MLVDEDSGIQYNTHPNINKQLFAEQSLIALKSEGKSFPLKSEVPLLKYRFHSTNEDHLPIKSRCSVVPAVITVLVRMYVYQPFRLCYSGTSLLRTHWDQLFVHCREVVHSSEVEMY